MEAGRRRRDKKGLDELFREQLWEIEGGEPLSQPLHAYVNVWLGCRRYSSGLGGTALPGSGAYLDQDAELMLAFDLLEAIQQEILDARKTREKNRERSGVPTDAAELEL